MPGTSYRWTCLFLLLMVVPALAAFLPAEEAPPAPAAPDLEPLAKTIRFFDAFPGSTAARTALLTAWQTGPAAPLTPGSLSAEVWSPNPVDVWMHGPVPSRITPTQMLLAWQRVLSEHYPDTLLTFAPRLRRWNLRVIERIRTRLDAIQPDVAKGDPDKIAEKEFLTDRAYGASIAAQLCPGPTDRTQGLPGWMRQDPDRETTELMAARLGPDLLTTQMGLSPAWSNNLAAEQTMQALLIMQDRFSLSGDDRYTRGPLVVGLLLQDREDARLLADLNAWIAEYSCDAPLNDDFLSLASVTQLPADPAARKIWQEKIEARFRQREKDLATAGCVLPPSKRTADDKAWVNYSPPCGHSWQLLPWRAGPLDGFTPLCELKPLPSKLADSPLRQLHAERFAELLDVEAAPEAGPVRTGETQANAIRALCTLKAAPVTTQIAGWCLLKPVNFLCAPPSPAPLLDDAGPGTVWIDGPATFYARMANAAQSHDRYLRMQGIDSGNVAAFAAICERLSNLRERLDAALAPSEQAPPAKPAQMDWTRQEIQDFRHARQWLGSWLAVDTENTRSPRCVLAPVRHARGGLNPIGQKDIPEEMRLFWINDFAIRPFSIAGSPPEDGAAQPVLTAGIGIRLANSTGVDTDSGWTAMTLYPAVLGPDAKGPVRYLDFLDPPGLYEFDLVSKVGVVTASGTRYALLRWMVEDPVSFAAAVAAHPLHRENDVAALIEAVVAHTPWDYLDKVRLIAAQWPNHRQALYAGLARNPDPQYTRYLGELVKQLEHVAAIPHLASMDAFGDDTAVHKAQSDFLTWLQTQPDPQQRLAALAQFPMPNQIQRWCAWLETAQDAPTRGLLMANLAPLLSANNMSFGERVRLALQYSDYMEGFGSTRWTNRSYMGPDWDKWYEIQPEALKSLLKAAADPALQPQAIAALAISDQEEAYKALAAILNNPRNAAIPFDPSYVILMGTSFVTGDRPEAGRELLRAWLKKPVLGPDNQPRTPTPGENQTWALAVDLLRRQYILTDDDLPAIIDRYQAEIAADLDHPLLRFPTHAAFAEAFAINPEFTLDRIAASLNAAEPRRRDTALAILTTQTRVDALNGLRPETLPVLENFPLRLEAVPEETKKTQAAAWNQWLQQKRGALLDEFRKHLE